MGFLDFHCESNKQCSISIWKSKTDSSLIAVNHPELEVETITDDAELKLTLRYVPVGVVAAICPWNYSFVLAMGKIGAALDYRKLRDYKTVAIYSIQYLEIH